MVLRVFIRHLRCIDGIRHIASDVKPEFIDWCQANIPGKKFYVNDLLPPLAFASDETFDLIFVESVFTHIPLDNQELWIHEIHRVLRPGRYALIRVLGYYNQQRMLSPNDREKLSNDGSLSLDAEAENASFSTQLIGSWDVFQNREQVLNAFISVFDVLDYLPGSLDVLILRKSSNG